MVQKGSLTVLVLAAILLSLAAPTSAGKEGRGSAPLVYVVPIHDAIDVGVTYFVRRSVDEAMEAGADLIIFDISTPGGRVDYAIELTNSIASAEPLPTVAWVTKRANIMGAISAGALIALSCKTIVMAEGSSIGDAQPVLMDGTVLTEEKFISPVRAEFRAQAERNGHSVNLAEAMVDPRIVVREVLVDGSREFLTQAELDEAPPEKRIEPIHTVSAEGRILVLTAREAAGYGLSRGTFNELEAVAAFKELPGARFVQMKTSWSEDFVRFLTTPAVASLLMIIGMIAIWIELKSPGIGVPGAVGVSCLGALFLGHYLVGMAEVADLILIGAGVLLLALELFVIPGFGVAGILGIVSILAGMVLSLQDFTLPDTGKYWEVDQLKKNLVLVIGSFGAAVIGFLILLRMLPSTPFLNRLVLKRELRKEEGVIVEDPHKHLIGKSGLTVTALRPSGKVEVNGDLLDVVAEGEFIDQGTQVELIAVEGSRIVVRPKA